ncbi:hypothetical protein BGZ92_008485, partial [Podila epicladia]
MKYTLIIAAVVALVQAAPLVPHATTGKPIPGKYIVVLKDGQTTADFTPKFNNIASRHNGRGLLPRLRRRAQRRRSQGAEGYPEVAYIEQDAILHISGNQTSPPSWGLTRVGQQDLDISQPYAYPDSAGANITAYIVDTGVFTNHTDFGGRATWGANFIEGSEDTDENGHGTHVAGTIGGTKYGVAKKVSLVGVKVLDAEGSGATSGVVA